MAVNSKKIIMVSFLSFAIAFIGGIALAYQLQGEDSFGFGVGFCEPGKARIMKRTGATWTRQPLVMWQMGEPLPPMFGKHHYKWDKLDQIVKEWTGAGFNMQLVVKAHSNWASQKVKHPSKGCVIPSTPPKEKYWDDYALWIQELVERYDGDGYKDMPGLVKPVLYYEIESEAQHKVCWDSTIEEYIKLLKTAYTAAKKANPEAKIILAGFDFGDIFDDFSSQEVIKERFDLAEEKGVSFVFVKESLKKSQFYDLIEIHWNRDYKGIYSDIAWIRQYSGKPIWAGDAASGPWIKHEIFPQAPLYPMFIGNLLTQALADKNNPRHSQILRWQRKEQAKLTTKKVVTGIDAGLSGIIIENILDWGKEWSAMGLGNFMFIGLLDKEGIPKPAYYTYKLIIDKIKDFSSVKRLNIGGDVLKDRGKGLWAFEFIVEGEPIYVLWYDDLINECPICSVKNEASITVDLSSYISLPEIKITRIITEQGQTDPETMAGLSNSIVVSETPIFVEVVKQGEGQ